MKHTEGYTLPEAVVTLAILSIISASVGMLSLSVSKNLEKKQYEAECNQILELVTDTHTRAVMSSNRGCYFQSFSTDINFVTRENNTTLVTKRIALKHVKVTGYLLGKKVNFSPTGTISTGGTLELNGENGWIQYLVLQPVTGRIYLTHEKP